MPVKLEMSAAPMSSPSTAYRPRFYTRYAQLKQRTDVEQVKRDLAFTKPYLARMIAKYFPADRNCSIVDLGCGSGALLVSLQEAGYRNTVGVETSPDQVEFALQLGVRSVVSGDLIPFLRDNASEVFDVV